jgi:hypothetical protein
MTERIATCRCQQLQVRCTGDPVRISVCHCLNCQKRSGSSFAAQARWPLDRARISGTPREWSCTSDSGAVATFYFCDTCGATVAYVTEGMPGVLAVPIGAFADPSFPPPEYSVYETRKHGWVAILGDDVEHFD